MTINELIKVLENMSDEDKNRQVVYFNHKYEEWIRVTEKGFSRLTGDRLSLNQI